LAGKQLRAWEWGILHKNGITMEQGEDAASSRKRELMPDDNFNIH